MHENCIKNKCVGSVILIPCEKIDPNPFYKRINLNNEFIASVKNNGIIQPLLVKKICNDRYMIISGERRLRAAVLAELIYVPCIIINIADEIIDQFMIIENVQRENIHYFDEAILFYEFINKYSISVKQLSLIINKDEKYIINRILSLNIDDKLKNKIIENNIPEEIIEFIINIKSELTQNQFIDFYINNITSINEIKNIISLNTISPMNNKRVFKFNNINLFINSFNKTVDTMQKAGIKVVSEQYESENYLEYVVRIPKITTSPVILTECVGSA